MYFQYLNNLVDLLIVTINDIHRFWDEINRFSKGSTTDGFQIATVMFPKKGKSYYDLLRNYLDDKPLVEIPATVSFSFHKFKSRLINFMCWSHGCPSKIRIGR